MPTVHHVKRARKDVPHAGIRRGDSYYWWKFRRGPKCYSKTYPRSSQLTQSEFLSVWYAVEEALEDLPEDVEGRIQVLEEAHDEIDALLGETEMKLSNVQDAFPNGSPVVDLLEERVSRCETLLGELTFAIEELYEIKDLSNEDREGIELPYPMLDFSIE